MKRWMMLLATLTGLALVIAAGAVYAQGDGEGHGEGEAGDPAGRGAAIYAEFCQACHGPRGTGAAQGPAFVALAYDPATARDVIVNGPEVAEDTVAPMPAYGAEAGGPLDEAQIDDLLAYLEAWAADEAPPLPEPNVSGLDEELQAGAAVYARFCAGCHGPEGEGRDADGFPGFEVDDGTLTVARQGSENGAMPAFGAAFGGPLGEDQFDALDVYFDSWDEEDESAAEGMEFLVIFMGVLAVAGVGAAYLSNMIKTET